MVQQARNQVLRVQPAETAARTGLFRNVPRYRRARGGGRAALRGPRPGPIPGHLLGPAGTVLVPYRVAVEGYDPQNVRTARMMRRRRVAFLLPSAYSRSRSSSQ